jgi:hypothetical protein
MNIRKTMFTVFEIFDMISSMMQCSMIVQCIIFNVFLERKQNERNRTTRQRNRTTRC